MDSGPIPTKPLTKEECKILLNFVEGSKIINNKATNATTNKMKNEEWHRIANQFNAVVTSCYRTAQQLRLKWENLKKVSRKRNTLIRMNNIKTGGGGPVYIPPDDVLDRVAALLGNTVDGLPVRYGGDAEVKSNLVCAKVGGGIQSDVEINQQFLTSEPTSMSPETGILQEITLDNAEVKSNLVCAKVGGGIQSDVKINQQFLTSEPTTMSPETGILQEITLDNAENAGECSTANQKLSTPRASGFKRKRGFPKSDDNRAARNEALANYYNMKTKLLALNIENVMFENKKLRLELEKLQSN